MTGLRVILQKHRWWIVCFISPIGSFAGVAALVSALFVGCGSIRPISVEAPWEPMTIDLDEMCSLIPVRGDTQGAVTSEGTVVLVAQGAGVLRSEDGGRIFSLIDRADSYRWPSVAVKGSRVWVSWVVGGATSTAVVAAFGEELGLAVPVMHSSRLLIDTELLALGGGRLLLFVTEIEGSINQDNRVYTVHCLQSLNGGLTWAPRSTVVTGTPGISLEDTRAVLLSENQVLLAYEREVEEGGASQINVVRSRDNGATWSDPRLLWGGEAADREPGGFAWVGKELWFVASTDEETPGRSYSGAKISLIRSRDDGRSWSRPSVLIDEPDQLAMGVFVSDGSVLLPSVRRYEERRNRFLALYRVDPVGRWRLECGAVPASGRVGR